VFVTNELATIVGFVETHPRLARENFLFCSKLVYTDNCWCTKAVLLVQQVKNPGVCFPKVSVTNYGHKFCN